MERPGIWDIYAKADNASGEMFSFERLAQAVANGPANSAKAMPEYLKTSVADKVGQREPRDDMPIVVTRT